jgi:hypothetical protein
MARWFFLYLIFVLFLINDIRMNILTDSNELFQRHIGAARENRYRAQQRKSSHIQNQQQSLVSADLLRTRWIELYNKQNKNNVT